MREKDFHHKLKEENLLFMFLSFQYFPMCSPETVKIMLFTVMVYAITVKKLQNRQGIRNFPDGYVHSQVNIRNFPDRYLISMCVF
jgi:phosphatidylethanolamine-binding protein (PEBP) family uncharacterized protein